MKIVILGAGPTGLGAAWRLAELGHADWTLIEASPYAGGLASSFRDEAGFTWDIGGHIHFSHYDYFDQFSEAVIAPADWVQHRRQSYVLREGRLIPYPFQNNIGMLAPEDTLHCLLGLMARRPMAGGSVANFDQWIAASFGEGIAEVFLRPYNRKVWAHPLEQMSSRWVGERVATVDLERVIDGVIDQRKEDSWGPNAMFCYPREGGTGALWKACAKALPQEQLQFGEVVVGIDLARRTVTTGQGRVYPYDALISTLPLPRLASLAEAKELAERMRGRLLHAATHAVGIGLRGRPPEELRDKNWLYLPDENCCFYRVTVLSNYSGANVPAGGDYWSLLCETSASRYRPEPPDPVEEAVRGLQRTGLIADAADIVSRWHFRAKYGYPVPSLERDEALAEVLPELEQYGVYSRGRFGAWKYEVSNQDHSFMQGVEVAGRLVAGEQEWTLPHPEIVNGAQGRVR